MDDMHDVMLPTGSAVPALGLGTWRLGESAGQHRAEVGALRLAFEMGYRLVDSAEMYGDGGAEEVVGEALAQTLRAGTMAREDVIIVTKACPQHAAAAALAAACERSLKRLQIDHIDLYLLHWRGGAPLGATVAAFERLQQRGLVRHWGVSNFDVADLRQLTAVPGGSACAANQVYYSLSERGIEFDLAPWQRLRRMPLMAYCPLDRGALSAHPALRTVAERHRATPAQVALAWTLSQPGVIALPKAVRATHLRENLEATRLRLDAGDQALLDRMFPPPLGKRALAMT